MGGSERRVQAAGRGGRGEQTLEGGAHLKYDHALKRYRDTYNAMTGAEMKGRAEGRAEVILEIARKMEAKGKSVEEMTSLPKK